ncbi:hypothetical protein PY093_18740 [Cytobacillus sp. S13-E01]|uniref:hypothetical protein n=1 Tax=Cytobacillus sp. S13-E01 TaxID=3031326 RepID=UPI0023D86F77|nr:hypothetical protein [Cytobacillus sp. S13-E01]MDF0728666.1 hypothetical protein [Cytobacillus sp. S13-E01]
MATKKKKVLFVIVEGDSDSQFFYDELQRKYTNELVLIKAYNGDIFTDPELQGVEIRERIRQFFIKRIGELKLKDFLGILHFSDTDGSFIPDDNIRVNVNQEINVLYRENGIFVNSIEQQEGLHYRNKIKRVNTQTVRFIDHITYNKVKIPYRLFYLSQHLEHVVFNELNVPQNQKQKKIISFLKDMQGESTIFNLLSSHFPPVQDIDHKHVESWNYIYQDIHSLQRYTNAALMYEYIDQLLAGRT